MPVPSPRPSFRKKENPARKRPPRPQTASASSNGLSHLLIKRSVSPDGRIDSLSVEFALPVDKIPATEIPSQAQKVLELQSGIVNGFLNGKGNGNGKDQAHPPDNGKGNGQNTVTESKANGAMEARMLDISGMNGKWGRRLFINVLAADGRAMKLFGNKKLLAEQITAAGFPEKSDNLTEGVHLNLPCRVVTKPSEDGRYLNIEKVLPMETPQTERRNGT